MDVFVLISNKKWSRNINQQLALRLDMWFILRCLFVNILHSLIISKVYHFIQKRFCNRETIMGKWILRLEESLPLSWLPEVIELRRGLIIWVLRGEWGYEGHLLSYKLSRGIGFSSLKHQYAGLGDKVTNLMTVGWWEFKASDGES